MKNITLAIIFLFAIGCQPHHESEKFTGRVAPFIVVEKIPKDNSDCIGCPHLPRINIEDGKGNIFSLEGDTAKELMLMYRVGDTLIIKTK